METLLLKMLAVQNEILATHQEILAEVRLLRRALERDTPAPAVAAEPTATEETPAAVAEAAPQPIEQTPPLPAPTAPAAPVETAMAPGTATPPPAEAPRKRSRGMLTLDELTDLGGEFLDSDPRAKPRVKPTDASELTQSLLDEIKTKNRAKRDAFAEFDRLRRDR